MMRLVALGATLLLLLTGQLLAAPASSAGVTVVGGGVTMHATVLYDGCRDYRFTVSVDLPAEAQSWYLDVVAVSPGGSESWESFSFEPGSTATGSFLLCNGTDHPGRYLVEGTGHWYDAEDNEHEISFTDSFSLRAPRSRTALRASTTNPRPGQTVKLNVTVKQERPGGFNACGYCKVWIIAKDGRKWIKVRGLTGRTNSRGKVTIKARYNRGRIALKSYVPRTAAYTASVSKTVTLR